VLDDNEHTPIKGGDGDDTSPSAGEDGMLSPTAPTGPRSGLCANEGNECTNDTAEYCNCYAFSPHSQHNFLVK
jgi:hypothetical protein